MTERPHRSWRERIVLRRALYPFVWLAVSLFCPFGLVFSVYLALAEMHSKAAEPCEGRPTVAGCFRHDLDVIANEAGFECLQDHRRPPPDTPARNVVRFLGGAHGISRPLSKTNRWARDVLYDLKLPLFRQAFSVWDVDLSLAGDHGSIWHKIRKHCREQDLRALRGEPVEPAPIYDDVRLVLNNAIPRIDKALADYAAIRVPFALLMWGWAAFEVAGLVCFYAILSVGLERHRARLLGGTARPTLKPRRDTMPQSSGRVRKKPKRSGRGAK